MRMEHVPGQRGVLCVLLVLFCCSAVFAGMVVHSGVASSCVGEAELHDVWGGGNDKRCEVPYDCAEGCAPTGSPGEWKFRPASTHLRCSGANYSPEEDCVDWFPRNCLYKLCTNADCSTCNLANPTEHDGYRCQPSS